MSLHIHCKRCETEKPPEEFSIARAAKNGRQSICKECAKLARIKWSAANALRQKEAFAENYRRNKSERDSQNKLWIAQNLERRREIARLSNARNPERIKRNGKEWANANRRLLRLKYARRRALKLQNTPKWAEVEKIAEFYATADGLGMLTGDWYEVDHIVPLKSAVVCGLHCESNLQVLPRTINRSKSNRYWPEMPI